MSCSFNSVDGMWKVEAESSAKTISLEDLLEGDVRCECVGQTLCRIFLLVLGLEGGGQTVRSTMKMMCNIRHKGDRRLSRAWMFGLRG